MSRVATRRRPRIGLGSTGISMTPAEFDALSREDVDDRYRYELIRGVLVVSPMAGNAEVDPNQELGYLFRLHQEGHPQGSIIDVTLFEQTLYTTLENRRRCDRAVWIGLGRMPDPEKDFPAIVIEFVSRGKRAQRRDYEEKLAEYLAADAREYWIVDRFLRIMTVFRKTPAGVETIVVAESGTYQTDLIPGFVLPLARILARADLWPSKKKRTRRPPDRGAD